MTEAEIVNRLLLIATPQSAAEYWLYLIRTAEGDKAQVLSKAQQFVELHSMTRVGPTEFKTNWAIPPELQ